MDGPIKALSHITGGGLSENLPRVLPPTVSATIDLTSWQPPAVFGWLAKAGRLSDAEMLRTFNCGIGMVASSAKDDADALVRLMQEWGESARRHRRDHPTGRREELGQGQGRGLGREIRRRAQVSVKKRVAILISGRGSNMKALVEAARAPDYPAEIVTVISNRPDAAGLAWAKEQGIPALGLDHKLYENREHFEGQLQGVLSMSRVDIVALAGFMRLMTPGFVESWRDRMINIHPSLLPAFKGLHTHERALEAGVKITGCTVHFVRPEMDEGPIIGQAAVPVEPATRRKHWPRGYSRRSIGSIRGRFRSLRQIKSTVSGNAVHFLGSG